MSIISIKYCDGYNSDSVFGTVYKAVILHTSGHTCFYNPLCTSRINWHKRSLLYMESWQIWLPCLYWCFLGCLVCIGRKGSSFCSKLFILFLKNPNTTQFLFFFGTQPNLFTSTFLAREKFSIDVFNPCKKICLYFRSLKENVTRMKKIQFLL